MDNLHRPYFLPPELLMNILEYLLSPKDVFSSALVCRTWCDVAVPILWRTNIVPFCGFINMLLMSPLIKSQNPPFLTGNISFKTLNRHTVSPEQWNRFLWLSRHVRKLHVTEQDGYTISDLHALDELHSHYGGYLLPNLHSIDINLLRRESAHIVPEFLLTPGLRSIKMMRAYGQWRNRSSDYDHLLKILRLRSPNLEEIEISIKSSYAFDSFHHFKHLKSLSLNGRIALSAFISILRCTHLRRLTLLSIELEVFKDVEDFLPETVVQDSGLASLTSPSSIMLPQLEILGLTPRTLRDFEDELAHPPDSTSFWNRIICPSLRQLQITTCGAKSLTLLRQVCQESPLVDKITIHVGHMHIRSEFLTCIRDFRNLRHLSFFEEFGYNPIHKLLGLEIVDFLSQLPQLEILEWTCEDCVDAIGRNDLVDFETLCNIRSNCPNLLQLSLLFRCSELSLDTRCSSSDAQVFHSMQYLQLTTFDKEANTEEFISYMAHILPVSAVLKIMVRPIASVYRVPEAQRRAVANKQMEVQFQDLIRKLKEDRRVE
ncbi:hypothetical protein FRC03_001433 [Tulasnella sp. 419]|nr:hypothetical protein FRC03_001433 [Tulasnella sp. 419]